MQQLIWRIKSKQLVLFGDIEIFPLFVKHKTKLKLKLNPTRDRQLMESHFPGLDYAITRNYKTPNNFRYLHVIY